MEKSDSKLNQILIAIIIALCALIIFCTITAFIAGKASFKNIYRKSDPQSLEEVKGAKDLESFKEFGMIRALTKADEGLSRGSLLVVTPWFSYNTKDSAFREELSQKKNLFSTIFLQYFSRYTKKELLKLGEKRVKNELLEELNAQLILGQIKAIYFDDYMFL